MADRLQTRASNVTPEAIATFSVELDQAQRDIEEATGRKRSVLKRAKSAGVNTKAIIEAIKLKRGEEEAVRLDMRDTIRYCGIIAPHLKLTQAELFGEQELRPLNAKAGEKLARWEADQNGYRVGLDGGARSDNPFIAGTATFVAWDTSWLRGQKILADQLGENATKADGGRSKPRGGRDRAAGADVEAREDAAD